MVMASTLPQISISLAPPEENVAEPFSPFKCSWDSSDDHDSFRPMHLTPPPVDSRFIRQKSPLRPASDALSALKGQGLERERFEAMLNATRERNAVAGAKKANDLRKEIALKTHKHKQVERRALFLSKVMAPPSPTATSLPKTPPDSPAIFHYTLPSPGLVSPLALFESLNEKSSTGPFSYGREPWVEQVDFKRPNSSLPVPSQRAVPPTPRSKSTSSVKPLPSLAEISARLGSNIVHIRSKSADEVQRGTRLPAFLAPARQAAPAAERPRLPASVGRLQLPVRTPQPTKAEGVSVLAPPASPCSPLLPRIEVTTVVVPRTSSVSPTELSESNLLALDSRERRAQDMLSTLRRRVPPSENGTTGHELIDDRKFRRRSAPADLASRPRTGFEHPVLALPGAF